MTQQRVRTRRQPGSPRQSLYSTHGPINQSWIDVGEETYMTRNGEYPCFRY